MAENDFLKSGRRGSSVLEAARREYNRVVRQARENPHNKDLAKKVLRYRKRLSRASAQAT